MMSAGLLAALVGIFGGVIMGLAARLGGFCTLGAIESWVYSNNQTRARMWGVTLGVAILGTFGLASAGMLDLGATLYHSITWNPIASILGGLIFGYGMAYTGNCGFSNLARIGGGDLRALVSCLVLAIFAYMTLNGPLAGIRVLIFPEETSNGMQGIAHLLAGWTGASPLIFAAVIALGLVVWGLVYADLRANPTAIFWSAMVGVAIVSAWWGTTLIAQQSLDATRVESHSFVAPLGRALFYGMTSSAGGINFAVGSVTGVMLGGFLGSLIKGHFRWEACEDPQELGRQMFGAALMGIGGVLALGCTIGQGITAFSTLSYSAPVTLLAIIIGAIIGLRRLVSGFQPE